MPPASVPAVVVSEMEILRSRSIAEAVVGGEAGRPGSALTTLVDSDRRTPLKALMRRVVEGRHEPPGLEPPLRAEFEPDPGGQPPIRLGDLQFIYGPVLESRL